MKSRRSTQRSPIKKIKNESRRKNRQQKRKMGKVYIASMNLRGKWADSPDSAQKINVTSAQGKASKNRRDFSPMTETWYKSPFDGTEFYNFEAFWQSGKVYDGVPEEKTKKFWKNVREPKRRYPGSKGMKVLYAKWDGNPEKMNWVDSRKRVYVPLYHDMMKDTEMANEWKKIVEEGVDVVIYDFDGPRLADGGVTCKEVDLEFLREKINDTRFPFGHGYVVAAYLSGIPINKFI
jgi:hypothetical protein